MRCVAPPLLVDPVLPQAGVFRAPRKSPPVRCLAPGRHNITHCFSPSALHLLYHSMMRCRSSTSVHFLVSREVPLRACRTQPCPTYTAYPARCLRRKVSEGKLRPHFAYYLSALEFASKRSRKCAAALLRRKYRPVRGCMYVSVFVCACASLSLLHTHSFSLCICM
jgi:hypothetical protein